MLNTPLLWSWIYYGKNPQLYLKRSEDIGLYVNVYFHGAVKFKSSRMKSFFRQLEPQVGRWKAFKISGLYNDPGLRAAFGYLNRQYRDKEFPLLEILRIELIEGQDEEGLVCHPDGELSYIKSSL